MRQKKLNGIKLPPECPCGSRKVVKKIGNCWTCQRCLDLDRVVNALHERVRREYMVPTQEEAYRAYYAATNDTQRSYYKNQYQLEVE